MLGWESLKIVDLERLVIEWRDPCETNVFLPCNSALFRQNNQAKLELIGFSGFFMFYFQSGLSESLLYQ